MGMDLAQGKDFAATATQADFAKSMKISPTSPELWAGRKETLPMKYVKLRECELGELCRVAAAPRPDICARLARIAPRINARSGSDVYRIKELVRAAKKLATCDSIEICVVLPFVEDAGLGRQVQGRAAKQG